MSISYCYFSIQVVWSVKKVKHWPDIAPSSWQLTLQQQVVYKLEKKVFVRLRTYKMFKKCRNNHLKVRRKLRKSLQFLKPLVLDKCETSLVIICVFFYVIMLRKRHLWLYYLNVLNLEYFVKFDNSCILLVI